MPDAMANSGGNATSATASSSGDRPERSRNAKAQARHRAKRKAYIEQLEQTVTKLQTVLALSPDQVAALPPPSVRIRQLEQDNERLLRENEDLRHQLQRARNSFVDDLSRRGSLQSIQTDCSVDGYASRSLKKRRLSGEDVYISPSQTPSPPSTEALAPPHYPPALAHSAYVPSSATPTSAYPTPQTHAVNGVHSSSYSYPVPPSATNSPTTYSQPGPAHSPSSHSLSLNGHHLQSQQDASHLVSSHGISQTTQHGYPQTVKVEEESYLPPHAHESSQHLSYATAISPYTPQAPELTSWHTYSADRTQIHAS